MKASDYFAKYPTCTWKSERVNVTLTCAVPVSIPELCRVTHRPCLEVHVVVDKDFAHGDIYKFPLKDYEKAKKFATLMYERTYNKYRKVD